MKKINISKILSSHCKSQFKEGWDYFVFLIIPLSIASLLVYFEVKIGSKSDIIISSLAIFIGLFFNAIVLLFDILGKGIRELKRLALIELLSNITFSILQATFIILSIICIGIDVKFINEIFNFLSFFFLSWFFLNLVMIMKRMYIIFLDEMNVER